MRVVLFPGVRSGGTTRSLALSLSRSLARLSVQSGETPQSIWGTDGGLLMVPTAGGTFDDGCRGSASCRKTRRRREEK